MQENVVQEKKLLRIKYKDIRNKITEDKKFILDNMIFKNIVNSDAFNNANTILLYSSINSEISTKKLIEYCIKLGKKTALPKCNITQRQLEFYMIDSINNLVVSKLGIAEPEAYEPKHITDFSNAVCIVPAIAYDRKGYRLGYGGGYYDNFLVCHPDIVKIGICYFKCLTDRLPHEAHDINVNFLITENEITEVCNAG